MTEKSAFWKSAMTYGIYLGLALVLYQFLVYRSGNNQNEFLGWISYVIVAGGVYYSQLSYRNHVLGGYIRYSTCLGFGVAVMLFSGVFQALYTIIILKYDPSILEQMKVATEEAMLQQGMPDEQIELMSQMMNQVQSPGIIAFSSLITFALFGLMISLVTSVFVKKTNEGNAFDEAMKEIGNKE